MNINRGGLKIFYDSITFGEVNLFQAYFLPENTAEFDWQKIRRM